MRRGREREDSSSKAGSELVLLVLKDHSLKDAAHLFPQLGMPTAWMMKITTWQKNTKKKKKKLKELSLLKMRRKKKKNHYLLGKSLQQMSEDECLLHHAGRLT